MGFFDKVKDALTSSDAERAEKEKAAADRAAQDDRGTADRAVTSDDAAAAGTPAGAGEPADGTQGSEAPAAGAAAYRTVTVRPGDTLSGLAEEHGVSWQEMAALNNLDNPDLIYPGQVFKLPHG